MWNKFFKGLFQNLKQNCNYVFMIQIKKKYELNLIIIQINIK